MEKEIIVSLGSGIVSVICAAITLISSAKATRIKSESDIKIETLKTELEQSKMTFNERIEATKLHFSEKIECLKIERDKKKQAFDQAILDSEPIEKVLNEGWEDLQFIKENIRGLPNESLYAIKITVANIKESIGSFNSKYGKSGASLPENVRVIWHKTKNKLIYIERKLDEIIVFETIDALPSILFDVNNEITNITECQLLLADAKQNIRYINTAKIIGIMA